MGTPARHGKKRKTMSTPTKTTPRSARKARKIFEPLSIERFKPKQVGTRVLSCGEGEQLGHPGRSVTKKPRAIDTFSKGTEFIQVAAGGVHSLVLTADGAVYSCGINEKGTVPVVGLEAEGSTDKFTEIVFSSDIKRLGKIVQVTAGASFSAALTEKGSVVAWGNLRDTQGEVNVHETLKDIQKRPVVVIRHKSRQNWHIVKIAAGENHLAMLSTEGELLTFGDGSMGQLGRSTRTDRIRSKFMVDQSGNSLILRVLERHQFIRFVNIWAHGFWTIARAEDGRLFACGLNNFAQLGVMPLDNIKSGRSHRRVAISSAPAHQQKNVEKSHESKSDQNGKKSAEEGVEIPLNGLDITAHASASSEDSSQEQEADDVLNEETEISTKVTLLTWARAFSAEPVWTHVSGVQHVVCRNEDGELFGLGKNTDNALGLGTWKGNHDDKHWRYDTLQRIKLSDDVRIAGVDATLGASILWTEDGKVYGFGCDTVGQLGLGIKEDEEKVVPEPRRILSAHLDGFRVISVSIADNHALFLAVPIAMPVCPPVTNSTNASSTVDSEAKNQQ